jgi:hypothetical protein
MPSSTTCKHTDCSRLAAGGKGYCSRHYEAWKRGRLPKARYKTCRVEGCRKRLVARGRCEEHFRRDHPGKKSSPPGEVSA